LRTFLLTGATGFVGKHILRELVARGASIRVLVRDQTRLLETANQKQIEVIEVPDLFAEGPTRLEQLVANCHTLIHSAWYAEPGKYLTSPVNLSCLEGTLRLAYAFSRVGGQRFVGLGSCAEYELSEFPLTIETPLKPSTLYAACKTSTFQVLSHFFGVVGVSFAWCRLFYPYGEGEDERRLVPYIRKQLQAGEPALLTTGTQIRDFIEVREAARMIVDASSADVQGALNICSGIPTTVRELAELVASEYGGTHLLQFGARLSNLYDPASVVGVPWVKLIASESYLKQKLSNITRSECE